MPKPLSKKFFQRPAEKVAEDLLGKILVRKTSKKVSAVKITELEIYDGFQDRASHASKRKTERNKIMFEEGGYFYVYLCYGMHWMINIVVGKEGYPSAILLRGGEVVSKLTNSPTYKLKTNPNGLDRLNFTRQNLGGPGKLSKFLKVNKKFNGELSIPKNNLWFEDWGFKIPKNKIIRTPRIGVHYAGPHWSNKKWRFKI